MILIEDVVRARHLLPTEIVVEQNTPEWLKLRRGPLKMRLGASEAETACNCGKYASAHDLNLRLRDWAHRDVPEPDISNNVTQYGHTQEDLVMAAMRRFAPMSSLDHYAEGNYFAHPVMPTYYGASPDGQIFSLINGAFQGLVELKAPFYRDWGDILDAHVTQTQFQMACCPEAPYVEYCSALFQTKPETNPDSMLPYLARPDPSLDPSTYTTGRDWLKAIVLRRVHRSEAYINDWMMPRLSHFSGSVISDTDLPFEWKGDPRSRIVPMNKRPPIRIDTIMTRTWREDEMPFIARPPE